MTNMRDAKYRVYVPFGDPIYSFFYVVKLSGATQVDELLTEVCDHMQLPKIYSLAFACSSEETLVKFKTTKTVERQICEHADHVTRELRIEAGDYPRIYLIQN